jgi:hypothetical protein
MKIHYMSEDQIHMMEASESWIISASQTRSLIRSVNQEGGTCAAYAIFNGLHHLYSRNCMGREGALHVRMIDEPARNRLYVRIDNRYYKDPWHVGTETEVAKELGFRIAELETSSPEALKADVKRYTEQNWPVLLRFDVGMAMSTTPYQILHHPQNQIADQRLWLPKGSEAKKGGHQILLLKVFSDPTGQEWILVVDSNWQAPRLWKIQELDKLYSANLAGWALWQDAPNPDPLPEIPFRGFVDEVIKKPLTEVPEF